MGMQLNELQSYKPQILAKAREYGIENIRVALPRNGGRAIIGDVTLVVDITPNIGWNFFAFAEDIEKEVLHCEVSVLTPDIAEDSQHKPYISDIVPL